MWLRFLVIAALITLPWNIPVAKAQEIPLVRVVDAGTVDPCQSRIIAKSSFAIGITTDTQLVALSGTTVIYVCGFSAVVTGTTPTFQFVYGTGTICATGQTSLTGAYNPTAGGTVVYGPGSTIFRTTAGQALCMVTTGTSPVVRGVVTYVQQ